MLSWVVVYQLCFFLNIISVIVLCTLLKKSEKYMMPTDPTNVIQKPEAADVQFRVVDCSNSHLYAMVCIHNSTITI
jgi:hypothetical protein